MPLYATHVLPSLPVNVVSSPVMSAVFVGVPSVVSGGQFGRIDAGTELLPLFATSFLNVYSVSPAPSVSTMPMFGTLATFSAAAPVAAPAAGVPEACGVTAPVDGVAV